MYLLNKVRHADDCYKYEIIPYSLNDPFTIRVLTVTRDDFLKIANHPDRDFDIKSGFLMSSADMMPNTLYPDGETVVQLSPSIFTLLVELVRKGAFFIPESVFQADREYVVNDINSFYNIRVSESSMYVGLSLRHDNEWFSSRILYVENGELCAKRFYIALQCGERLESCNLPIAGKAVVNRLECNVFEFDGQLDAAPRFSPIKYLPLPLVNYLALHYNQAKNTVNYLTDVFEERGISPSARDYAHAAPTRAVVVGSSLKCTSATMRHDLAAAYAAFQGTADEFARAYGLQILDRYSFSVISAFMRNFQVSEVNALMRLLRVNRSLSSLVLMSIRCGLFVDPFLYEGGALKVVARGGGGGDRFVTTMGLNNIS
jgi:hypothetical protein